MSDLLSSASLLIAIVTVLYALWYSEIKRGIKDIRPRQNWEKDDFLDVLGILLLRALPLAVASLGLALVFLKDALIIVRNSLKLESNIHDRIMNYDAVSTAFVLVESICVFLFALIIVQFFRLVINLINLARRPSVKL
jgi:hypothetical protein